MYDSLLVKLDRLEYLHDNKLPTNVSVNSTCITHTLLTAPKLPDVSYDYKAITQQQVDQQGPYVYHNEQGVPVPCSERVVPLSHIMNDSYQFADEHRGKRKAEEEPEGQPGAKRQGLLGLDDDVSRRTSALMSAHDDVAEEGRSVTPGEEQQEVTRKPTRAAPRARASAKQPSTTSNGVVPEEKEEDLLDVEEVNGLPLPKGASLPDEYGVRIITKSRKVEYANNRIMAPVASPFEDFQIGYRDSSNNPLKGATKARRREYLGLPNSNAAFYDRRVANYNSVLQKEEDYDKELVEKHKLHPTLGIFMPDSINSEEYPAERHLQEYNPVVQVGPKGQIFHASRSVLRYRLDQEANRIKERLRLKASVANFLAEEGVTQGEVALPKEVVQQHREEVLKARSIDPATLPEPLKLPSVSPSPKVMEEEEADVAMDRHRAIEELLQAADQVESDEHASRMAGNTAAHKSSRPYDAIRDVFTENAPPVAPAPLPVPAPAVAVEPPAANTFNLSFLAEVAEDPARAEEIRREELRRAQEMINEVDIQQQAGMAEPPREGQPPYGPPPVEASVMDPRLFPSQDIPHGNVPNATAEASRPQYYDPPQPSPYQSHEVSSQWHREEPPVQLAPHPRSNDFLRTALNPQTPPPHYPVSQYPPPPEYPGPHLAPAPATQVPYNAASQRGSLPALRPVRAAYEDGTVAPEYHGSPGPANRPGMVLSNNGAYYAPPPARPFHNGYMIDEQQQLHHHQQVGPPVHHQPVHPMTAQGPYPAAPDSGYPYPPLAPAPAYHPIGPYHPLAAHPLTPGPPLARGPPGSSSRPYRKLEPAPAQSATKPRGNAQRPELRTVQFDYREGIKDYIPIEAPPVHGPSAIRGWSHQNLKQRRVSKEMPAPAPTDESS
jgi:hypothetical protein